MHATALDMPTAPDLEALTGAVLETMARIAPRRALVAISGIDGAGKGTIAARVERELAACGKRAALIHLDPWHRPQRVRFADDDPGGHFYRHAFRWQELFERLVDPLVEAGSVDIEAEALDLPSDLLIPTRHAFRDVDVVLLEGIFLLQRPLVDRYDLRVWIDCPYDIALARAIARNQEGLAPHQIVADYRRIYFPAEQHHIARDDPRGAADLVVDNG
jgi:uridine kinase